MRWRQPYEAARKLLMDPERLSSMGMAAGKIAVVDAAEQIYGVIQELAK